MLSATDNIAPTSSVIPLTNNERSFPIHSPRIEKVEVVRKGRVRRAKLYYLRKLSGKAAKLKEAK